MAHINPFINSISRKPRISTVTGS